MKIKQILSQFLNQERTNISTGDDVHPAVQRLADLLLDQPVAHEASLCEASVHRGRRSRIFNATYTGPDGFQIWRTTKSTNRQVALAQARQWAEEARQERARRAGRYPSLGPRMGRGKLGGLEAILTQKEVGLLLKMTERGVRAAEARAFWKLRNHPHLQELWLEYRSGQLDETGRGCDLSPADIQALFDLAWTVEETELLDKVINFLQRTTFHPVEQVPE